MSSEKQQPQQWAGEVQQPIQQQLPPTCEQYQLQLQQQQWAQQVATLFSNFSNLFCKLALSKTRYFYFDSLR